MSEQTPEQPPAQPPGSQPEPTAAITSRSAVIAAVLLLAAIVVAVVFLQAADDGEEPGLTDASTAAPVAAGSPAVGASPAAAPAAGFVTEGVVAPDFTLTSLEGEVVSLSDYAGRPVLLNFWASWCPPCREEFPVFAEARAAYAADGFEILGVTRNDQPDASRRFVADSGAEWVMLPDPDDAVWQAYGPVGLPTSYFIDAEGVVQRVHIGPVDEEQLADHLAAIDVPGDATTAEETS
ncbi:MAG: TlpA disulfide reductase family protein [Chloroflexota bacterium]|jgi:peroxiredoxin